MKHLIYSIAFFLVAGKLLGQTTTVPEFTKEYYLQKSKNQNTAGWIMLSTGVVLTTVGVIGFGNSDLFS